MRRNVQFLALCVLFFAGSVHADSPTIGASGERVSEMQQLLSATGYYSYEITGYFGEITQSALQRFQCDKMNICSGSPQSTGWGSFGPRTYAVLAGFSGPPRPSGGVTGGTPPNTTMLIATLLEQVRALQAQLAVLLGQSGQYFWQIGDWGACSYGMQTRAVSCAGNAGSVFADNLCSMPKPLTQQSCIAPGDNTSLCQIGLSRVGECTLY